MFRGIFPIPASRTIRAALGTLAITACATVATNEFDVPRTFDPQGMATFELPLAVPEFSPVHVSEDYYYSLPVRPIYRSYPVYHPEYEPAGYREMLLAAEPEIAGELPPYSRSRSKAAVDPEIATAVPPNSRSRSKAETLPEIPAEMETNISASLPPCFQMQSNR